MSLEVKVPSVGESITSGVLGAWHKKDGEYVKEGEVLFEVETDKVTSEVFAEKSGQLKQLVPQGTTIQIGQVVAQIDTSVAAPAEVAVAATAPAAVASAAFAPAAAPQKKAASEPATLTPAARFHVADKGVNPAEIPGTGKGGRITKGDVLGHSPSAGTSAAPAVNNGGPRQTRKALTPIRRKIAERLLAAQQENAILTTFNEVDMSSVMALRTKIQDRFTSKHGIKLGFMSFFVKAATAALKEIPALNSRIENDELVENHYYDIGVAVSTEKGLMVPVIRNADQLSFAGIEKSIGEYAVKARNGKMTLPDMEGGSFTITNGGTFGSLLSTPIINPPQSGILGMHSIQERPVAINGRVEIRPMMYLALSYDHRVVDGKGAVTFLVRIKEFIENPGIAIMDL
ncbi:MAG: 2-oxoglutarate dehydrogenase complex dihydrolipoyllysine-residue succinyltransferase [Verrucomicrobiota bacterium]